MKILHLFASPVFSGPAENILLLAEAQRALGHEVSVAIDRKRLAVTSEEPLLPVVGARDLAADIALTLSVKSSPRALMRDLARLRAIGADVVHAHFTHDHWLARLAQPRAPGGGRALIVRSIHAPRSLTWSTPRADAWTLPYPMPDFSRGPSIVLPALVDPIFAPAKDRRALRQSLGLSGAPIVGMVSTFQPSRRHALALAAFAALRQVRPEARLILVGDGALAPDLRRTTRDLGLDGAVIFAGYQRGADFVRWLQSFDLLWLLGLGNDFSARAAAQARACGVRVVGAREGALAQIADTLLADLTVDALVCASLEDTRRQHAWPTNREIAAEVIALYSSAYQRAPPK